MIYFYIKGLLIEANSFYAVLETGGIAYQIFIPVSAMGRLGQIGDEVTLYTSFIVREQSHTLYGFITKEEKELFEILLTVSGVGAKTALALLGHLSQEALVQAVHVNDVIALSKVPGIGKKTAEKLILELKGKLKELLRLQPPKNATTPSVQDALAALMNLGYSQSRAEKAVEKARSLLPQEADLSELISLALKHRD